MKRVINKNGLIYFSFPQIVLSVLFLTSLNSNAAQLPFGYHMEVFLFEVNQSEDKTSLKLVDNISQADGYDNQPSFSPDGQRILYSSKRDGKQTDIYEYKIDSKKTKRLTFTEESEYSPAMEKGNKTLTAVREGGDPYQSVHRYTYPKNKAKKSKSTWAVASQTPIGYYGFNNEGIAVGWARWANAIYIYPPESKYATFVTDNAIPSKPLVIPGSNLFSFIHRQGNDEMWIKSLDASNRSVTPIVKVFNNNFDYAWTPDKSIITAKDSQLYIWKEGYKDWQLWVDLSQENLKDITRVAVSPNHGHIALVAKVRNPDK